MVDGWWMGGGWMVDGWLDRSGYLAASVSIALREPSSPGNNLLHVSRTIYILKHILQNFNY